MTESTTSLGRLLLNSYLESLTGQAYRTATVSSRYRCLSSIDKAIGLETVTPQALETLADIRGWSPGTRYQYASVVSLFTAWATREGLIDADPFAGVRKPRQPRYRPRPISLDQFQLLVDRLANPFRAWAMLAAYAGMRREEITKLRWEHLVQTLTGFDLLIPDGKGGKSDSVPAHPEIVKFLSSGPGAGFVFTTRTGEQYTPNHLGEMAAHAFAGVGVPCGLHQLRHLFGTKLYASTHDIYAVRRALRHDSIQSTEVYVQADTTWIREAVCAL